MVVNSGGTLGGTGNLSAVVLKPGGHLNPGSASQPATLNVGSLSMFPSSVLDYDLGPPGIAGQGVIDLVAVAGDVTVDGVLNINTLSGFGPGSYPLMTFGGEMTYDDLNLASAGTFTCPSQTLDAGADIFFRRAVEGV